MRRRKEGRYGGLGFRLEAGASGEVGTLAGRFLFLPLAHGVGVTHNYFVHPGEGLREEDIPFEEAQVASVKRQGEDHIRFLCWWTKGNKENNTDYHLEQPLQYFPSGHFLKIR